MERVKSVDTWIDELSPYETQNLNRTTSIQDITIAWQKLPCIEIPTFNGSSLKWVKFVIKFKEIVHNDVHLKSLQKLHYLQQNILGIAKRTMLGFSNEEWRYIPSLKRLKYKFEQKSRIVEDHLSQLKNGKQTSNNKKKELIKFDYSLSDYSLSVCILHQLKYESNIYSTNAVCETICCLPNTF